MSHENVEIVRRSYEQFVATGRFVRELASPDFVWDMSNFHGWPEQQAYEGIAGAEAFLRDWAGAWDDREVELEALRDAGHKVVGLMRQRGRSKSAGMTVDMSFAQVWTLRDGKQTRMDMFSDRDEALKAVGLED